MRDLAPFWRRKSRSIILQAGGNAVDAAICGKRSAGPLRTRDDRDRRRLLRAGESPPEARRFTRAQRIGGARLPRCPRPGCGLPAIATCRFFGAPETRQRYRVRWTRSAACRRITGNWASTRCSRLSSTMPRPAFRSRPRAAFDWKNHHGNLGGAGARLLPDRRRNLPARVSCSDSRARPRCCARSRPEGARRLSTRARWQRTWSHRCRPSVACTRRMISRETGRTTPRPSAVFYKGVELVEHPPNGQGATAILLNHILAEFRHRRDGPPGPRSAPISRPRRPSSPMPRGTGSWAMPTTSRACRRCWTPPPARRWPHGSTRHVPCPARRIPPKARTRKPCI